MNTQLPKKLSRISLHGFKSIGPEGQTVEFRDVTVLLGANGAGKSNLVSFFRMLNYLTTGALQNFIGENGYADSFLHYGSKNCPRMGARLVFDVGSADQDTYEFILSHASGDTLIFTEEFLTWKNEEKPAPTKVSLGAGHKESQLEEDARNGGRTSQFVLDLLQRSRRMAVSLQYQNGDGRRL